MIFYAENINHETEFDDEDMFPVSGVYLHGKLQELNGFDLVCQFRKNLDYVENDETIEEVDVIFADGTKYKAIAYIWNSPSKYKMSEYSPVPIVENYGQRHGLICEVNDRKANMDALEKFNKRVWHV